jgi:sec-independent protein translocase protein TatB
VFNVGPEKLILLFVIALIVLGPNRLPDAARSLGRMVGELRRVSGGFQNEVREALAEPKDALTAAVGDLRSELGGLSDGIHEFRDLGRSTVTDALGDSTASPPADPPMPPVSSATTPLPPSPDDPSLN